MTKTKIRYGDIVITVFDDVNYSIEKSTKENGQWHNTKMYNVNDLEKIDIIIKKMLSDKVTIIKGGKDDY